MNVILVDLVLFFEVGKTMGADQVKQTIQLILEDYKHLKPEDFKLCFNRLKKGYYGKLYDRLDGQIILDCLAKFDAERDGEIEAIRAKENRQLKQLEAQPLLPAATDDVQSNEVFARNMQKLRNTLIESKKIREANKPQPVERKPNPVQDLHTRWLNQFDKLCIGKVKAGGARFIRRYGKMIDVNGYLEHKHYQFWLAQERVKNAHITQND